MHAEEGAAGVAMAEYLFNVDNGYLEGLVRGFRSGILNRADYLNLVQCETVEGKGMSLGPRLHRLPFLRVR